MPPEQPDEPQEPKEPEERNPAPSGRRDEVEGLLIAAVAPVAVALVLLPFRSDLRTDNVSLVLVLAVLIGAMAGERLGGAVAAVLAAVSFDFLFDADSAVKPAPAAVAAPMKTDADKATYSEEECNNRFETISRTGAIYFAFGRANLGYGLDVDAERNEGQTIGWDALVEKSAVGALGVNYEMVGEVGAQSLDGRR